MIIRFTKGKKKPDSLTCTRNDGTTTWARLRVPVQHDLIHYVVETTLGLKDSFYSLLARGVDITDFEKPREQQNFQTPTEALQTEFIVGLLQIEMLNGETTDNFNGQLRAMCEQNKCPAPPEITSKAIETIRKSIAELIYRWSALKLGENLELSFDENSFAANQSRTH